MPKYIKNSNKVMKTNIPYKRVQKEERQKEDIRNELTEIFSMNG